MTNPIIEEERDRIILAGKPNYNRCDNKVCTSKYTLYSFIPVATMEQFRRFANMYFLVVGLIMAVGEYSDLFESAVVPWTTLGPLAIVIAFSLLVEGSADIKRHNNDTETNNAPCVVLSRSEDVDKTPIGNEECGGRDTTIMNGRDIVANLRQPYYLKNAPTEPETPIVANEDKIARVAFQKVRRMDIRQGHFVLVKNREMVPADIVLIASSCDGGSAYIETSSIDGETNLKLRTSPHLPQDVLKRLRRNSNLGGQTSNQQTEKVEELDQGEAGSEIETLEQATKRVTRMSTLAYPNGVSILKSPFYRYRDDTNGDEGTHRNGVEEMFHKINPLHHLRESQHHLDGSHPEISSDTKYVAALTSEPPNPHVNTFTGKLTLPPVDENNECIDIPLGAENVLLRGAVLRNTEWVIGLVVFTGVDTKLVKNSVERPSKFSQLDHLMNQTVVAILCIMILCIGYLASRAAFSMNSRFDELWYAGYNKNTTAKWPYLEELDAPQWIEKQPNWMQYFFLNVTLLTNFVPLSLYVTVELINFCMLWFIYVDLDMYDDTTDTRAVARSTIVTDLGRIQYIFSDKTGTLTQNVMRFKRCSVDGMVFGAPIQKSRPGASMDDPENTLQPFHPLRKLLVGKVNISGGAGLEGLGASGSADIHQSDEMLTFNAEMFLRVMSLCHTVVVEKDLDQNDNIDGGKSVSSTSSSLSNQARQTMNKLFNRKRTSSESSNIVMSPLPAVSENEQVEHRVRTMSTDIEKGGDGAPLGFAYQAESPDEGALVSAASRTFDFQVISRDKAGIRLRCSSPSILEDPRVVDGLKNGTMSLPTLAAESASGKARYARMSRSPSQPHLETWAILAVNKFDSDRKRMSVLIKAPPELGELTILFCKGADSSMLDPDVIRPVHDTGRNAYTPGGSLDEDEQEQWELQQRLGLEAHLGDFASEGLRTLVLGMKIVTAKECEEWLQVYNTAATSLKNRDQMLKEAAEKIERNLYIVGATAIEDKLQRGVPETIATLGKAGIKLWVLTGDKRETAVEIGYSTHVLTPKMHLTEVPDNGINHVRTQMAMEFIRLVKLGKLPEYQRSMIDKDTKSGFSAEKFLYDMGKCYRSLSRSIRRSLNQCLVAVNVTKGRAQLALQDIAEEEKYDMKNVIPSERRAKVRKRAEDIIQQYLRSPEGVATRRKRGSKHIPKPGDEDLHDLSLASEDLPSIFNRAQSARLMLAQSGEASLTELRTLSLAQLTAQETSADIPLVDEDVLSLMSFFPGDTTKSDFDRKKRTILERLFAVDREVRKGKLVKHLRKDKLATIIDGGEPHRDPTNIEETSFTDGPRALVIEGAALKHLLGDAELEELIFSVASKCDAVIACRVSPKQKAELVKLVRKNVTPEPVTLAIGDGANDVGMIQAAHVGIGISGKEGKQAVNASDFSIGQFRFLETLILIHGRWDFFRLSIVVLFSFYKNAVMAGCLVTFAHFTVFSGTPLFNEWIIAMLNFVAAFPILSLGLFDRCLSKEYVRSHPEVYKATRNNELMTTRSLVRWTCLVLVHIFTIYYFTIPSQALGGGMTAAWDGLTRDLENIGDGEGGDLSSAGTVAYTCLIFLLAYKVLFEARSLVHGQWPALAGCKRDAEQGFSSRFAYTWHSVAFGSLGFYIWAIFMYSFVGRQGPGTFSLFVDTAFHVLSTRSMSWMLIAFVPVFGMIFDVTGKVFSNMFYPTQTQIHVEREAMQKYHSRRTQRFTGRPNSGSGFNSSNV